MDVGPANPSGRQGFLPFGEGQTQARPMGVDTSALFFPPTSGEADGAKSISNSAA